MYYRARFYHPALGRFVSADTIVPGAGNPQNFSRYSYVLNNPLKYIDPSGHYELQPGNPMIDGFCTPGSCLAQLPTAEERYRLNLEEIEGQEPEGYRWIPLPQRFTLTFWLLLVFR
jgi:hypothetical protein